MKYVILVITLLFYSSLSANSLPEGIEWADHIDPKLLEKVKIFQNSTEKPSELTQVHFHHKIHIGAESVHRHIQTIWYYPKAGDIQDSGNESVYFNQKTEKLTLNSALSVSPDSQVQSFDPKHIQLLDPDSYNTFSDTKEVIIATPGLEIGGYSVLDYEVSLDKSLLETSWSQIIYPRSSVHYKHYIVDVTYDEDLNINHFYEGNDLECTTHKSGFTCRAENVEPLQSDYSIVWRDIIDQLVITEGSNNWDDTIDKMQDKFDQALLESKYIDELFDRLIKDKTHLEDKIYAIHEFVSRDIRYNSMSEIGHTITPHHIDQTIKNRYGDCKDKSALLLALLKKLGFSPKPVLIATNRQRLNNMQLPSVGYFNHVVVCNDSDGFNFCLDATDTTTHWQTTSSWIQGASSLELKLGQKPKRLDSATYRWRLNVDTNIVFDDQGGQKESTQREYLGEYGSNYRYSLNSKNLQEKTEWAVEDYHNNVTTRATPSFEFKGFEGMGDSIIITSVADIEPFLEIKNELSYTEKDFWLVDELSSAIIKNKHYGYDFPGMAVTSNLTLDLGGVWKLTFPGAELALKHQFGSLDRTIIESNKELVTVKSVLNIPAQHIMVEDIERFNRFINKLKIESEITVFGKKS